MEDVLVQMMARAVIAEVEPEDVAALVEQMAAERQHVHRIGAAFPAVQQDREIARRRSARGFLTRVMAEQAHAVTAIDDLSIRNRQHRPGATRDQRPAQAQAGHDGLEVGVGEPAGGREFGGQRVGGSQGGGVHGSMRIVDEPGRLLTKSAPTRKLGVVKPGLQARPNTSFENSQRCMHRQRVAVGGAQSGGFHFPRGISCFAPHVRGIVFSLGFVGRRDASLRVELRQLADPALP